jgi:hypothetical protein
VVERLEERLAPDVKVTGLPDWRPQGPGPIQGNQPVNIPNSPVAGAVSAIAVDPSDLTGNTVYIGTVNGGVWKSTQAVSGPPNWTPLTDQLPSLSITALAIDPTNPQIVWAGTGESSAGREGGPEIGLMKSSDGGLTWQVFPSVFAGHGGRAIHAIVPTKIPQGSGHVLLVASEATAFGSGPNQLGGGLLRSTDGGNGSFRKISGNANDGLDNNNNGVIDDPGEDTGLPGGTVEDLVGEPGPANPDPADPHPANPNRFYAAMPGKGVFRSDDGGLTWHATKNADLTNVAATTRIKLAVSTLVDPATHNRPVYAGLLVPVEDTLQQDATGNTLVVSDAAGETALFQVGDTVTIEGVERHFQIQSVARNTAPPSTTLTLDDNLPALVPRKTIVSVADKERLSRVFRTTDLGAHWVAMPAIVTTEGGQPYGLLPGGQGDNDFSITADATDPGVVYVGGDRQPTADASNTAGLLVKAGRLFRGDSSGWQQIVGTNAANSAPHADSRVLVFSNNALLEGDDGGIYRWPLSGPWQALDDNLAATEFYSIAWDTQNNVILGGAQDNGVSLQSATDSPIWNTKAIGDGQIVQTAAPDWLFYSTHSLGGFTVEHAGNSVEPELLVNKTSVGGSDLQTLDEVDTVRFTQPYVVNAVDPNRLLFGTDFLYESVGGNEPDIENAGRVGANPGDRLSLLGGNPLPSKDPVTDEDVFQLPPAANVGTVNALVYGGTDPTKGTQADVGYVGTEGSPGTGDQLFVRQHRDNPNDPADPGGVPFRKFDAVLSWRDKERHEPVVAIATEPQDWGRVYVLTESGKVWFSPDGGKADTATWGWTDLTDNLVGLPGASNLDKIAVVNSGGTPVILVGGDGGVYRRIGFTTVPSDPSKTTDPNAWTEFGSAPFVVPHPGGLDDRGMGLPNAKVTDIQVAGNRLVVGTFGRGAWMIPDMSAVIGVQPTVTVTAPASGEVIELVRDKANPGLLDIFEYPALPRPSTLVPSTVPFASLKSLTIKGGTGNDTFILDASNGPIPVVEGIDIDGGGGNDTISFPTAPAGSRLAPVGNPQITTTGTKNNYNLVGRDAFGVYGVQKVSWTNIPKPTRLASLGPTIDVAGTGLTVASARLQQELLVGPQSAALAGTSLRSFVAGLGGAQHNERQPEEDPGEVVSEGGPSPDQPDTGTSILNRLFQDGVGGFDLSEIGSDGSIATLAALRQALDNLDNHDAAGNLIPANVNNVTLDTTTDVDKDGIPDATFRVKVVNKHLSGTVSLDVNAGVAGGVGEVRLNGEMQIGADFTLDLTFGVDGQGFFMRPTSAGTPELSITNLVIDGEISGSGRLGFLGVDVSDASLTTDPNARITFKLNDPGGGAQDGLIRLEELDLPALTNLITVTVQGDPGDGRNDDLVLTGSFSVSAVVPGVKFDLAAGQVRLAWPDLASPALVQLSATDANGAPLLDFETLKAQQVLDQLIQLRDRLDNLTSSPALNAQFQLAAGKALGDLADAGQAFTTSLLDHVESSPGSGEAGFDTVQDAAASIRSGLDLDPTFTITVHYDTTTGELTFQVPLTHTFDSVPASLDLNHLAGGAGALGTGFTLVPLTWSVTMEMNLDFGFLLKSPQPVDSFFVRFDNISAQLSGTAAPIGLHGNLGPLALSVDDGSIALDGNATITVTDPTPDGRLTLADFTNILANPAAIHLSLDGSISLSAGTVVLFPDLTTADPNDGEARVTGFRGSVDLHTGVLTASADAITLAVGTVLQVAGQNLTFTIDPAKPSDAIATLKTATVTSPLFPQLPSVTLQNLSLFRTGFTLGSFTLASPGLRLQGVLDAENVKLTATNLKFTNGTGFNAGTLALSANRGTLFPTLPVSASVEDDNPADTTPGLSGTINLRTGAFTLFARRLTATLGGLVQITANLPTLTFDPAAAGNTNLLRVLGATGTLSALAANGLTPTVSFSEFGFHKDGTPFLSGGTLKLPTGFTQALGIGGLFPLQIDTLGIKFPDPTNFNTFTLSANGHFLMTALASQLPFTPIIHIGDPSQIGTPNVQSFTVTNNSSFTFDISVDSLRAGKLTPINLGPITLGFTNLHVGTVTFDGQITLGAYQNGVFNGAVSGFVRAVSGLPGASGTVQIAVQPGSQLTFDNQGGAALHVVAQATLDAQGNVGPTSGSVSGARLNFGLDITATRTTTAPFVSLAVTPSFNSLSVDEFVFQAGNILLLKAHQVSVVSNPAPGQPIATLNDVEVTFPAFPFLQAGRINGLSLFSDHVEVDSVVLQVNGTVGAGVPLAQFTNLQVTLPNLVVNLPGGSFNGTIQVTGGSATLLPQAASGGLASVTGLNGSFQPNGSLKLTAATATGTVNGVVNLTAQNANLALGPGNETSPLLSADQATLKLPLLGSNVELSATSVAITQDGSVSFQSAALKSGTLLKTLSLSNLVPFNITTIQVTGGGQRFQLDNFTLQVTGTFNFSVFSGQLAHPILHIGGLNFSDTSGSFNLAFAVNHGNVTVSLDGLVTLGFSGAHFGPVTVGTKVTLGHFFSGHYVLDTVGASVDVQVDKTKVHVDGTGTLTTNANGNTSLDLNLALGFSFDSGPGPGASLKVNDFRANLLLNVTVSPTFQPVSAKALLVNASVGSADVTFGSPSKPLLALHTTQVTFNLDQTKNLLTFGSVSASLPGLPPAFAGVTGTVSNFAIGQDLSFKLLPGFGVQFTNLPKAHDLGLPDFLPVQVTGLGLKLGPQALQGNPLDLVFIVSGGLQSNSVFPIDAKFNNLQVNVGKLAQGKLLDAIEGLDDFFVGIKPFKIGPVTIGGGLGLGIIHSDDPATPGADLNKSTLFGRITGYFQVAGIGAGIDLVFTEVGPLLAKIDAPLAVPLGPTGILMTGVTGGITFGAPPLATPATPLDLLRSPTTFKPISVDEAAITDAILAAVSRGVITWSLPLTVALQGHFTTVATPGILEGNLTLAANIDPTKAVPAIKFLGSGDLDLYGVPVGGVGAQLDLTNPIAPIYDFAFAAPTPGSPLAFLLPAQGTFTVHLGTDGLVQAPLVGLETFISQLASGSLNVVLDKMAASLNADRTRPLAQLLLAGQGTVAVIDAAFVKNRMLALLPHNVRLLPATADISAAANLGADFFAELFEDVQSLTPAQAGDLLNQLSSVLSKASLDALNAGWAAFNPRLEVTGLLQPTILGIPFGLPDDAVTLVLDKGGIGFGFKGSLQRTVQLVASAGNPMAGFLAQVLSLGFTDQLGLDFKLGLGNVFASLLAGNGLPTIDPLGDWLIGVTGELHLLNFRIGQVTGFVFSPQSAEIDRHVQKVFLLPAGTAPDPTLIPIATQVQYDNLVKFGGFMLTGQLFVPKLLSDPVGLLASTDFTPPTVTGLTGLFNFGPYIEGLAKKLLADAEVARMQLFVPSFATLLDFDFSRGFASFSNKLGAQAQTLVNAAYLTGFTDAKLLSIDVGQATVDFSSGGLQVQAQIPWLANSKAAFGLTFRNVNLNKLIEDLAATVGFPGLNLVNGATLVTTRSVPVASAVLALTLDQLKQTLKGAAQLPATGFSVQGTSGAAVRFFSPGFGDATNPNVPLVQRDGGVTFDAALNIKNLVQNASFHFEAPLFTGTLIPNFTASASVDKLTVPGLDNSTLLQLTKFTVSINMQNNVLSAGLGGHLTLFGADLTVNGSVRFSGDSSVGIVQVDAGSNSDFGKNFGFTLNGDLSLQFNASGTNQSVTLPNGQTRTVVPGARLRVENAALAAGGFTFKGSFDLTVSGNGLTITADATTTLFDLVQLSADGTFEVQTLTSSTGASTSGLVVDVALAALGSAAVGTAAAPTVIVAPAGLGFQFNAGLTLQANTFLNQSRTGLRGDIIPANTFLFHADGSLQLKNGTTDSFKLNGDFDVKVSNGTFSMTADSTLDLFGTTLNAGGTIQLFTTGQRGILLDMGLALGTDATPSFEAKNGATSLNFILEAKTSLRLQFNSTTRTGLTVPPSTFRVHASGDVLLKQGVTTSFRLDGTFDVAVSGSTFSIQATASTTVLGSTFAVTLFRVDSSGNISMSVNGQLSVLGFTLATATFNLSKVNGAFRLEIPSSSPAAVNVGFATVSASGFMDNAGHFSFTGSTSVSLPVVSATLTVTLADSGFAATLTGTVTVLGVPHTVVGLEVKSDGTFVFLGQTFKLTDNSSSMFPNRAVTPQVVAGGVATLTGTISDKDPTDEFILDVDWDDGTAEERFVFQPDGTGPVNGRPVALTHRYLDTDPEGPAVTHHTIHLRWQDQDGSQNTGDLGVAVDNLPGIRQPSPRFVAQTYRDLLGRPVDPAGLAFWSGLIDHGVGRVQVARAIENSLEFRIHEVQETYRNVLRRDADVQGLNLGVQFLAGGATRDRLRSVLFGSDEYFRTQGGGTVEGFVAALYRDALGRAAEQGAPWARLLGAGLSRDRVALAVLGSAEAQQSRAQTLYHRLLNRAADTDGLSASVQSLRSGVPEELLQASIAASEEYFAGL